eukprot:jgi/Pico_ML_1/51328/g2382.t1
MQRLADLAGEVHGSLATTANALSSPLEAGGPVVEDVENVENVMHAAVRAAHHCSEAAAASREAECNPKKKTLVRTWCIASVALCLVALSTMAVTQHLQVERKLLLALGLPVAWFLIGSIGKGSEMDGGRENHTGTLLMAGTFSWFVVGFVACVLIREGLLVQDESLHCEGAGDLSMLTS